MKESNASLTHLLHVYLSERNVVPTLTSNER
jgi:hypothetical protein